MDLKDFTKSKRPLNIDEHRIFTKRILRLFVCTPLNIKTHKNHAWFVLFIRLLFSEITQINAEDEDFGDFGTCSYDIFSDEMKESFTIDKVKGEIVTKVRLDREERRSYEIPVIATDGGGRSGFTMVKLKVGDLNDNAPVFHLHEYKTAIYANISVNTTFMKVSSKKVYGLADGMLSPFLCCCIRW